MTISGFEKLTLLDYPGLTACIIFTQGCNFRCPFCYNSDLIKSSQEEGQILEEDIIDYLMIRRNILDGVVISGGEPLVQKDILQFITKIKSLGFKIKLDTNGSNPEKLKKLIDNHLIDYVAMDIKNDFTNYDITSNVKNLNIEKIKKSINIIENANIEYEFRTTIVKEFHDIKNIENIINYLKKDSKYYLQNYQDRDSVLEKGLHGFSDEELKDINKKLNNYSNVIIRGLKKEGEQVYV